MQRAGLVSSQQGKQWLSAAKQGDTDSLKLFLEEVPALLHHQGSGIGHTAIHWCAAKGHMNCMDWLLQQGGDINSLNAEDSTALHAAAANGQESVVRFLLDQPAMNVGARDSSGETAKEVAIHQKWLAIADLFPHSSSSELDTMPSRTPPPDHNQDMHQCIPMGDSSALKHPNLQQQQQQHQQLHTKSLVSMDPDQSADSLTGLTSNAPSTQLQQQPSVPGGMSTSRAAVPTADIPLSSLTFGQHEDGPKHPKATSLVAGGQIASTKPNVSQPTISDDMHEQSELGYGTTQSAPAWKVPAVCQQGTEAVPQESMPGTTGNQTDNLSTAVLDPYVIKDQGKAWLDAARYGKLQSMKTILSANSIHKAALVAYNGAGTSYGLMGHTALHWAAAKGYTEAVTWLLQEGANANSPNQGGSTPLHSAAEHGQAAAAKMLLHMGLADDLIVDTNGDTPKSLALSLGHAGMAQQIGLAQHVNKLRGQPQRQWDMQTVRGLLQLTGVNMAALLERHEVMTACQQQLDMMPKPVGLALLRPVSCTPAVPTRLDAERKKPSSSSKDDFHDAEAQQSINDDEDIWTQAAAAAKQRGNDLYQRAEHRKAVQLYTMAINLQTQISLNGRRHHHGDLEPLAILYSNRSAANASLNLWSDALDDAEACISLAPKWIKGYCRAAAAFRAQGRGDKVIAAYKSALALDPSCQSALQGLQSQ